VRITLILFVLSSVLLSAGSQLLLKFGMTKPNVKSVLAANESLSQIVFTIAASPSIIAGLFCFGLSAIVWLFVLSKIPLSTAYPFVALGIAITVVGGRVLFDEPISGAKLLGVVLIILGVTTVAAST
jgi:multidrug transporter EmrE-like cation transporter